MSESAIHMGAAETLLSRLVACPSVNPGADAVTGAPFGEQRMAELLAVELASMGGDVHVIPVLDGRPNVVAHFRGNDPSRTILLDAHLDTVSHLNMSIDPFGAVVRDGRLYGRGACDTKGPMTAMLLAVRDCVANGDLVPNVVVAGTCDEESGGSGVRALIESGVEVDAAIAAEPTDLAIVWRHKGIERAHVTIRGRAAHSSAPDRGCNAVYVGARLVTQFETMAHSFANGDSDPELGYMTLAVTTIHGGTAPNIIPDSCEMDVDIRVLPGLDSAKIRAGVDACVAACCAGDSPCEYTIEWTQRYPALANVADAVVLVRLEAASMAVTTSAQREVASYGTNAGFYAEHGIPSVVFGPGSITDAHTDNESIDLSEIVTAARVLRHFLSMP